MSAGLQPSAQSQPSAQTQLRRKYCPSAQKGEGPPSRGGPSIVRPSVRLTPCRRTRRRGPRERRGSSSRMPATAAKDNETLDHLLSVVNDPRNVGGDS